MAAKALQVSAKQRHAKIDAGIIDGHANLRTDVLGMLAKAHELEKLAQQDGYRLGEIERWLGMLYRNNHNLAEGLRYAQLSVEHLSHNQEREMYASARINVATSLRMLGRSDESLAMSIENLALCRTHGWKRSELTCLIEIGYVHEYYLKDFEAAVAYYTETEQRFDDSLDPLLFFHALQATSRARRKQKMYDAALPPALRALDWAMQHGLHDKEYAIRVDLGVHFTDTKEYERGIEQVTTAIALFHRHQLGTHLLGAMGTLCQLYHASGQREKFDETAAQVLAMADAAEARNQRMSAYNSFSDMYAEQQNFGMAYDLHVKFHHEFENYFTAERDKTIAELRATFEKEKAEQETRKAGVQKLLLQRELQQQQRELQLLAAHVLERNASIGGFLQRIEDGIHQLEREHGRLRPVGQLMQRLQTASRMQETLQHFDQQLLQANRAFLEALAADYPALSKTEMKVCSLLLLELSNKDMAALMQCSARTIESHRLHIQKKLPLRAGVSLLQFLKEQQEGLRSN